MTRTHKAFLCFLQRGFLVQKVHCNLAMDLQTVATSTSRLVQKAPWQIPGRKRY